MKGLLIVATAVTLAFLLINSKFGAEEPSINLLPEEAEPFTMTYIMEEIYEEEMVLPYNAVSAPSIWYWNNTLNHTDVNITVIP